MSASRSASTVSGDWLRALQRTTSAIAAQRTLAASLDDVARDHADRVALLDDTTALTYGALTARINRTARWALAQGLNKGDSVALMMPNRAEYLAIWLGLTRVGVLVALINTHVRGQALAHSLNAVAPKHVIVDAALNDAVAQVKPELSSAPQVWISGNGGSDASLDLAIGACPPGPLTGAEQRDVQLSDVALRIFTSGTTGLPKAANVSHRRLLEWSHWFAGLMDATPDDRMFNCLPLYHSVGGVVATGSMLVAGGSVVIREKFSASRFWDDVADTQSTVFQYIGELCRYLVNAPASARETAHRLRIACGNGLRGDVWEAFQQRFNIPRVLEFYAATEGSFSLFNVEGKPGCIGRVPGFMAHRAPVALIRFDVASGAPLRDDQGFCIRCGEDEPGEAIGRLASGTGDAAGRFEGYTSAAESEKKILRNVFAPGDAWFRTGDLMARDRAGFYRFVDRVGDTFRWKGENVSTEEVASVVAACPGVIEATVYGVSVPGADGRAGMAAIAVADDFDLAALHALVCERLPAYARPVFIRMVGGLAHTETFKQTKHRLVDEGFDAVRIGDPLYIDAPDLRGYVPLTPARVAALTAPATSAPAAVAG